MAGWLQAVGAPDLAGCCARHGQAVAGSASTRWPIWQATRPAIQRRATGPRHPAARPSQVARFRTGRLRQRRRAALRTNAVEYAGESSPAPEYSTRARWTAASVRSRDAARARHRTESRVLRAGASTLWYQAGRELARTTRLRDGRSRRLLDQARGNGHRSGAYRVRGARPWNR